MQHEAHWLARPSSPAPQLVLAEQEEQEMLMRLLGAPAVTARPSPPSGDALPPNPPKRAGGWAAIAAKPAATRPPAAALADTEPLHLELLPGCRVLSSGLDAVVQLHQTSIVTLHASGKVTLNSGGWRTYSTLKAMNAVLEAVSPPTRIVADGHLSHGAWRVVQPDNSINFVDGVSFTATAPHNFAARAARGGGAVRGTPPSDYVCRLCGVPGHWLDRCPQKSEPKPPPPSYTCRLCQRPGHWIQLCPSIAPPPSKDTDAEPHHGKTLLAKQSQPGRSAQRPTQPSQPQRAQPSGRGRPDEGGEAAREALVESLREMSGASRERCLSALKVRQRAGP
jgi:hypothetical protein